MLVIRPRYVKRGGNINTVLVPVLQKGLELLSTGAKRKIEEVGQKQLEKGLELLATGAKRKIQQVGTKIDKIVNGAGIVKC